MVSKAVSIITDGMDTLGNKQEITGYYVTMTAFVIENEEYTNNIKIAMLKGIKEHYEKRISEKSLPERTSI